MFRKYYKSLNDRINPGNELIQQTMIKMQDESKREKKRSTVSLMNFNRRKIIIAVIIISIVISSVVFAVSPYGMIFLNSFGGLPLNIAENNGAITYPAVESTDKGITMKVLAAVSNKDNIIINIKFFGLSPDDVNILNNRTYDPNIDYSKFRIPDIDASKGIDLKLYSESGTILKNQTNTDNDYNIVNNPRSVDEDGNYSEIFELQGGITSAQNIHLEINRITNIYGTWTVNFELPYVEPVIKYKRGIPANTNPS